MPESDLPPAEETNVIKIPIRRVMDFLYIILVAFVLLIVYLTYPPAKSNSDYELETWEAPRPTTTQPFIRVRAMRDKSNGEYKFPVTISIKDTDNTIWKFHVTGSNPSSDIAVDHTNKDGEPAGWVTFQRVPDDKVPSHDNW